jgi:hypothetical protein
MPFPDHSLTDARAGFAGNGVRDWSSEPDGRLVGDVNDEGDGLGALSPGELRCTYSTRASAGPPIGEIQFHTMQVENTFQMSLKFLGRIEPADLRYAIEP